MRSLLALLSLGLLALISTSSNAAADTPLRVGVVSRTFYYVPLWAAIERGFYKSEGLDVTLEVMQDATTQVAALLEGKTDITVAPTEAIISNAESGGPLRMLAGNSGKLSHFVIAQSKFKRIEDLKGARIGILSLTEGSRFHFQEIAEKHGLHYPGDYTLVQTGGAPARHKLLLSDTIDVGLQSIPWSYVAEDAGFANLGDVAKYIPDWQFTTFNADGRWASANRDVVVRFLRATQRAVDWMYANREEAVRIAARELQVNESYADRAWVYFTSTGAITRDMAINEKGLASVVKVMRKAEILKGGGAIELSRYVDDSFHKDAQAVVFATGPFLKTPSETKELFDKLFATVAAKAGVVHRTVVFSDWKDVGRALVAGQVDVAWMGGGSRYAEAKLAGAGPAIATALFQGKPSYRALLIARNGISFKDFPNDAKGLSLQLTHRNSTTGWLAPYAWLADRDLKPERNFAYREGTQHRDNELIVAKGEADLVSDSDNNRELMIRQGAIKPDDGSVVWTSGPVPFDPIQIRADLDPMLAGKFGAAFVTITPEQAQQSMMPNYTGFAPATDATYAGVVEAWRRYGKN